MKLLRTSPERVEARAEKRGAALLMSLLVLFVLVAIVFQINVTTGTDSRVARNDVGLTTMDLAIESALLQVYQQLEEDGQTDSASGAPAMGGGEGDGGEGAADESSAPSDSREDSWGKPQQTSFEEMDVRLRILVQDEDSKLNVLTMLDEDEDEAEEAFQRVVRILDVCREDTEYDIDSVDAERMAREMREFMLRRTDAPLPMAELLTYDDARRDIGLPLSLREFIVLEPFEEHHFRDFRDEDETVVHSIGSYLTVWSSVGTAGQSSGAAAAGAGAAGQQGQGQSGQGQVDESPDGTTTATASGNQSGAAPEAGSAPAAGANDLSAQTELTGGDPGYAVNLNTAPPAVLKSLFDSRDLNPRFWDEVIRYRNEEEEQDDDEEEETEPVLDEFGEEIVPLQIFDSPSELAELDDWIELEGKVREKINTLVCTESQVFSIYISAIKKTGIDEEWAADIEDSRDEFEKSMGNQLVRTVRAVVWRRTDGEEVEIVSILRWEVIDYVPFEVLDFPDEDR